MRLGHVRFDSGRTFTDVYSATTAVICLLHVMQDGATAAVAVIGNEGVVGIPLFMLKRRTRGRKATVPAARVVEIASHAWDNEQTAIAKRASMAPSPAG